MSETPKPCPICGNPAPFFYNHRAGDVVTRMAGCTGCGLRIDARNWNRRAPGPATAKLLVAAKWFRALAEQWGHGPQRDGSDYSRLWDDFSKDIDDAEHGPAKAEKAES